MYSTYVYNCTERGGGDVLLMHVDLNRPFTTYTCAYTPTISMVYCIDLHILAVSQLHSYAEEKSFHPPQSKRMCVHMTYI